MTNGSSLPAVMTYLPTHTCISTWIYTCMVTPPHSTRTLTSGKALRSELPSHFYAIWHSCLPPRLPPDQLFSHASRGFNGQHLETPTTPENNSKLSERGDDLWGTVSYLA